ncbi:DNA-binding protein [Streptomyces sp. F001]|uniref:helix-turn-helix domain-containing protein n=1 Tax=Streptomyces sp. F001 TaxID=1510026 RepID=UPI00101E82BA|nr:helix-turn-helix domain-containing protein [Streptomyces sp. F001]RZB18391.1 DNA-binding protein [Streptomyces sp. F001]
MTAVAWSRQKIEALGPTTDVPTTAAIVGVDPDTLYAMIRRNEWTMTRILRLGRKIKIPTRDLVAYLYAPEAAETVPAQTPAVPTACQHAASSQVTGHEPHASCGCTPAGGGVIPLRRTVLTST